MLKNTKILLVGDDTFEMYVKAFYQSFHELGYKNTELFAINRYICPKTVIQKFIWRMQSNIALGSNISRINRLLLEYVNGNKPELVFFYTVRIIYPSTIKKIRNMGIKIFMYNNDNPFAEHYPKHFWRHYRNGLKYADAGFVYRLENIEDYKESGCKNIELLRSYYMKSRNFYMENNTLVIPDVVFIGHNEDDERRDYIKALLDNKIEVAVTKKGWQDFEKDNPYLMKLENTQTQYNEIMNASKIAIVFLSKINHDTYTRRCFEIPAVKSMMLSVYTDDIASMFEPNKEAVYFNSKEEFVEKVQYYLKHENERNSIANAGYERLMRDGHETSDRVQQVMNVYREISEGV